MEELEGFLKRFIEVYEKDKKNYQAIDINTIKISDELAYLKPYNGNKILPLIDDAIYYQDIASGNFGFIPDSEKNLEEAQEKVYYLVKLYFEPENQEYIDILKKHNINI